jgi:hypothetical protein
MFRFKPASQIAEEYNSIVSWAPLVITFHAGFLLGFGPEDWGNMFLRKVGWL